MQKLHAHASKDGGNGGGGDTIKKTSIWINRMISIVSYVQYKYGHRKQANLKVLLIILKFKRQLCWKVN